MMKFQVMSKNLGLYLPASQVSHPFFRAVTRELRAAAKKLALVMCSDGQERPVLQCIAARDEIMSRFSAEVMLKATSRHFVARAERSKVVDLFGATAEVFEVLSCLKLVDDEQRSPKWFLQLYELLSEFSLENVREICCK